METRRLAQSPPPGPALFARSLLSLHHPSSAGSAATSARVLQFPPHVLAPAAARPVANSSSAVDARLTAAPSLLTSFPVPAIIAPALAPACACDTLHALALGPSAQDLLRRETLPRVSIRPSAHRHPLHSPLPAATPPVVEPVP